MHIHKLVLLSAGMARKQSGGQMSPLSASRPDPHGGNSMHGQGIHDQDWGTQASRISFSCL